MTNINVLENQISEVKKYLTIVGRYAKLSRRAIEDDINLRGAAERYLYLVCQALIDLAESYIAFRNFRKPGSMSEIFYILEEEKVIAAKMREKMVNMVGFRNYLAHDYGKIDYEIVEDVLTNGLKDIQQFCRTIGGKIE